MLVYKKVVWFFYFRIVNSQEIFSENPIVMTPIQNPCIPSPCGPYSECRDIGGFPSCACSVNYIGSPPNCKPECTINSECTSDRACMQEKCRDPCPGSCGLGAICNVINHTPVCICPNGFTGDPFSNCQPVPSKRKNFYFPIKFHCYKLVERIVLF